MMSELRNQAEQWCVSEFNDSNQKISNTDSFSFPEFVPLSSQLVPMLPLHPLPILPSFYFDFSLSILLPRKSSPRDIFDVSPRVDDRVHIVFLNGSSRRNL